MVSRVRSGSRDATDLLRSAGGVLLAVGSAVVFFRKGTGHAWGDFALFLVVLIPAVVLYALALSGVEQRDGANESWRSVLMVTSILLSPIVLGQLLALLDANSGQALFTAGVFLVTALIAGYGGWRARVPYAVLLAGLALLVAWLIVWATALDHPSVDTFRVLLIVAAALLLAVALRLARDGVIGASELATIGGIAAVAAGVIGIVVGTVTGVARPFALLVQPSRATGRALNEALPTSGLQHFGWDLYLLVVSVALVWVGSRARARGLGYVGGFGLLAFLTSVAVQVTRIESGHTPTSSLVGWPLALLLLGIAGLMAPVLYRRDV
jgi:hypothetical protein